MARRPRPDGTGDTGRVVHFLDLARETIPPIHPAGVPFVAAPAAVALLGRKHSWIARPAALTAGACAAFFRHPKRVPPTEPGVVVAPADGTIALVDEAVPPAEAGLGTEPLPRVSTFLSIFDVHVQRAPIAGTVTGVTHTPGAFLSADLPEASRDNERTTMTIRTTSADGAPGPELAVVQIAGLIARRIVCKPQAGDALRIGDTYGLIRFGSRVDVYFPAGTRPRVSVGQRAVGGETPFAHLDH
ncbi:phosphatidylserine decarboxylase [Gordonia sp. zg691]|uniref:Phosphatidylserine decarboxylase proenzyme n=1 Tax=Gordonia jinghuaiqii TaxID=2758710 RepID=A0A7D7LSA0_9ACTN|nr:phosphatidylserine decarboxylase [Gordonia jinghuaiqii]MBD0861582.1 phosphatidylserine decarboxylase [Gordonia jinghuaiqii]MCR5977453.1 phosphatidylserine decarboxylase [Gordonia jinghuaiqii]QMT02145.1 phosphatidylserine decarboxylase [Gordonia jinghuaiqii]